MIFMSQSGITDPARAVEWDAWYVEHLRIMLTVPGISSTQRFKTDSPGYPPSLAMPGTVSMMRRCSTYHASHSAARAGSMRPL